MASDGFLLSPVMQNREYELAKQFALHTNHHFFLTGKAGSGKTTLLRDIAKQTNKNFVIVAPTGVAAINAGGVTIHSQFNLPLTSFIPSGDWVDLNVVTNRRALLEHMNFRKDKRKVIQEMELLIIDEVSMVRADVLDAVDFIMRTVRKNPKPFGGVQLMLIGDMHQLPPVVKDHEWSVLKNYYASPYFFDSVVWKQLHAAEIELKKIYRQSDERFLRLLNNIRQQHLDESDYEELKKRYNPTFKANEPGYIVLTTHNYKANSINENELSKLRGHEYEFEAKISGEFPEHIYPCERVLRLKEGAQVMFTRNDATDGMYYNGKLATVKSMNDDDVIVTFHDNGRDYKLKREVWENITYKVVDGQDKIEKNLVGSFSQYPLRLAWAITIHKSQGLTFDKVIIDAGSSFAAGQVYVALSRCRSLDGIVLYSLITQNALRSDEKIAEFSDDHHSESDLEEILDEAKVAYANEQLKKLFDFNKLRLKVAEWKEELAEKEIPEKEAALQLFDSIAAAINDIVSTAEKFEPQLQRLLTDFHRDKRAIVPLRERSSRAVEYFTEQIFTLLIEPLHHHITALAYKTKVKKYVQQLQAVEDSFWNKLQELYNVRFMDEKIFAGEIKYHKGMLKTITTSVTSGKKQKGGTYNDTLDLHRKGKTAKEIAEIRGLAISTVKGHLGRWVAKGEIKIEEILPANVINELNAFYKTENEKTVAAALRRFGEKYDANDVRIFLQHLRPVFNLK